MNISNLTIEQLKALAYDAISESEVMQKNLNVINNEIAKKVEAERIATQQVEQAKPATKPEVKPTKEK